MTTKRSALSVSVAYSDSLNILCTDGFTQNGQKDFVESCSTSNPNFFYPYNQSGVPCLVTHQLI